MSAEKITVQATVAAARTKVWEYYNNPEHIVKWNFAADDWQCPRAENDLRVGGKYSSRMEAKDGSWGFDFEATYNEVNEGKGFTYTIADGRQVNVEFADLGSTTKVTITFEAENQNPAEMQRGGWQAILDNFKRYAESH